MDFILLKNFLAHYSLPTVIIAVLVSIITVVIKKIFKEKISKTVISYAPFLLAIVLYIVYDTAFVLKAFTLRSESFYAGLLCGSLSAVIVSAIKKISQGKPIGVSATILLIESLLDGYVCENRLTEVASLLDGILAADKQENVSERVLTTLKDNAEGFSETELKHLASVIVQTVNSLTGK